MNSPSAARLAYVVSTGIAPLARAVRRAADLTVAGYGLSGATAWPLVFVQRMGEGGEVRQHELADALAVEGPSLVRVLDRICAAGLLERRRDPDDGRGRLLHLTSAGRRLAAELEEAMDRARTEWFRGVGKADLEATLRVFAALDVSLRAWGADDGARTKTKPVRRKARAIL